MIIKHALRELIMNDMSSTYTRGEAIDALIRIEREEAVAEVPKTEATLWCNHMHDFRTYRTNNGRIQTIKEIRRVLNVGLMEALIIVKGIESHDNIPA